MNGGTDRLDIHDEKRLGRHLQSCVQITTILAGNASSASDGGTTKRYLLTSNCSVVHLGKRSTGRRKKTKDEQTRRQAERCRLWSKLRPHPSHDFWCGSSLATAVEKRPCMKPSYSWFRRQMSRVPIRSVTTVCNSACNGSNEAETN